MRNNSETKFREQEQFLLKKLEPRRKQEIVPCQTCENLQLELDEKGRFFYICKKNPNKRFYFKKCNLEEKLLDFCDMQEAER